MLLYADAVWGALRGEVCLELSVGHSHPAFILGHLFVHLFPHRCV